MGYFYRVCEGMQQVFYSLQKSTFSTSISYQVKMNAHDKIGYAAPPCGPVEAVRVCFRKYATFRGRASRSEYWWFWLFSAVLCFVVMPVLVSGVFGATGIDLSIVDTLVWLAMLLPFFAVGCRRLHDIGESGYYQLTMYGVVVIYAAMLMGVVVVALQQPELYLPNDTIAKLGEENFPAIADEAVTNYIDALLKNSPFVVEWILVMVMLFPLFFVLYIFILWGMKGKPQANRFDEVQGGEVGGGDGGE